MKAANSAVMSFNARVDMETIFRHGRFEYICPFTTEQSEDLRVSRALLLCATLVCCLCVTATAQHTKTPVFRVEAGTLNARWFTPALTFGISSGWQFTGRTAILLRYLHQIQNQYNGEDPGGRARNFLLMDWEYSFGTERKYQRQALGRIGIGALFRPILATAPVVSGSLEFRYGLTRRWALVGSIEDEAAGLRRQDYRPCPACPIHTYGGKLQHNIGFIVAGEWRR